MPAGREDAASFVGAALDDEWPQGDLLDLLPVQAAAASDEESFGVWLLIERQTSTVVGDAGFMGAPGADGTVEIGYSVVPSRRGRGYAREAVTALVGWAAAQPGVQAVVAHCDRENEASIRILERVGFVRTAEQDRRLRWRYDRLT